MLIVFALSAFTILSGVMTVITKTTQKNYVNGFNQSLYFTVLYSLFQAILLFLIPPYKQYNFEPKMLLYPFLFSIFFMAGYMSYINALGKGPTSLTNIINNFMQLVPVIAGLVIWKESITVYQLGGLILFIVIIFLFNQGSYHDGKESKSITPMWVFLAVGAALFGGISVIFTKQHMIFYSEAIKEYLIMFNLMVVVMGAPYILWAIKKKKLTLMVNKRFIIFTLCLALGQNINNIIYMFYINRLKSASFFPLIGILGIVAVVIMSRLILKERISIKAYIGIGLSLVAIYLLGIK